MEDTDSFHVIWLHLIKTIQSTSIERFEDLEAAIKARHPSQYAGENLELLAAAFRKDAHELTLAGQYNQNLTLAMLKTFLIAGGSGNEDFRFQLRATKQKLDQALLDIGYKEKSAAQAHMVAKKLTNQDIYRQAEDAYRLQYDRKEWPPASHATDTCAPSATLGNVSLPEGSPITRAEVTDAFNKGGIGSSSCCPQTQRKKPRRPKYHPVPGADRAPDAFTPSIWTTQQRNAAHKIISHVSLACTAMLRMALMQNALGTTTSSIPIIWDSGASISISPDPVDFQGTLQSPGTITQLKGI